jgi:AcrR family transcriptional regulator
MTVLSGARRPGAARNPDVRLAILRATSELLLRDGYEHLTIEGIAARAKVGKPTIYRWWPSKSALIADCLVDEMLMPETFYPATTDDVVADITSWFEEVVRFSNRGSNAVLLRSLVTAAIVNPEVGTQLSKHLGAGPESLEGRLLAAVDAGQLVPETPIAHIIELLLGAIVVRVVGGTGLQDADAEIFVTTVLSGSARLPRRG